LSSALEERLAIDFEQGLVAAHPAALSTDENESSRKS
jgi:hypothetical protein